MSVLSKSSHLHHNPNFTRFCVLFMLMLHLTILHILILTDVPLSRDWTPSGAQFRFTFIGLAFRIPEKWKLLIHEYVVIPSIVCQITYQPSLINLLVSYSECMLSFLFFSFKYSHKFSSCSIFFPKQIFFEQPLHINVLSDYLLAVKVCCF